VITHGSAATSSGTGGGASVAYSYELTQEGANTVVGTGWGALAWGDEEWGDARTTSSFLIEASVWSLDKWGEDLIACRRNGKIWVWDTSGGVSVRAAVTHANAPIQCKFAMVSPENQHLIAFGAHNGSIFDPMLILWSSSEDYTTWTAASTNSAGSKRLDTGNEIMCAVKSTREIVIFTDSYLWTMSFTGPPSFFSFTPIGNNGGIRSPNAAVEFNGITFWMTKNNFYFYDGRVKVLKCDVWDTVFKDIDINQAIKTFAALNIEFSEVWWFYASDGAAEVDRYVIFNVLEETWSYGTMARTAYIGDSGIQDYAYATGTDGIMYNHEKGTDDDGAALSSHLSSYDVETDAGDELAHVATIVPDFETLTGSINMQLKGKRYPQSPNEISSTLINVTSTTKFINPRIKARQISLHFTTDAVGDNWRLGTIRAGTRVHGKK
jgi:hypothetical protein